MWQDHSLPKLYQLEYLYASINLIEDAYSIWSYTIC